MIFIPDIEDVEFPSPSEATEDGLVAIGGNFSSKTLLKAYSSGIFPWFVEQGLPFWFSPDPRMVLNPQELRVSKDMKRIIKNEIFVITFDKDFEGVIRACAETKRKHEDETWISEEFVKGYLQFHKEGFAHSVEAWKEGELVGGLYGVSLGKCFFGESMFSKVSNASKAAFITLVKKLEAVGFHFIDCQVYTDHLASLGAKEISREDFLERLKEALAEETIKGSWARMN